ncbi:transcriptional regulator with XRE-family HTH domain [Bacillus horti]|uniref:Transcriptional regulator with XRE-family HTH domain n=2 Tax=Caldalkalibacillus horti TaxID=77523 RepID=A0ABT9VWA4_9BACI|nr:transcriptional regulator with XRE-family HTH domain [Bacillus horti]
MNLTQKQLADQLNVSRSVLTKWEIGTLSPDLQALVQLSELFDVSIDALVGRPYPPTQVLREIRKLYTVEEEEAIDEEMIQIIQYLHSYPEIKQGMHQLLSKPKMQRKPVEEIMKTAFRELLK